MDLSDISVEEIILTFDLNNKLQSSTSKTTDGDNGSIEHPNQPERQNSLESDASDSSDEDHGPIRHPIKKKS